MIDVVVENIGYEDLQIVEIDRLSIENLTFYAYFCCYYIQNGYSDTINQWITSTIKDLSIAQLYRKIFYECLLKVGNQEGQDSWYYRFQIPILDRALKESYLDYNDLNSKLNFMNNIAFPTLPADLIKKFKENDPMKWFMSLKQIAGVPNLRVDAPIDIDPKLPTLIVEIGPSGAGKNVIVERLVKEGKLVHAVSATTRARREGESEGDYIWMRQKRENESEDEYKENLIKEYGLVEHNFENQGKYYGLPLASLEAAVKKAKETGGSVLIHSENEGAKTLLKNLSGKYNVVILFVTAENYETLFERITKEKRNNPVIRMETSVKEISEAQNKEFPIHYVLMNPQDETNPAAGIERGEEAVLHMVEDIHKAN